MNISRISKKRLELALRLISQEVRSTLGAQDTDSSDAVIGRFTREAKDARTKLLPLLQAAAALSDIDFILRIERRFLAEELAYLAVMPQKESSLNMALSQLDATLNLLRTMRETASYKHADLFFTISRNRVYGMPRDEAQQFFISHAMRLRNLGTGYREGTEAALLNVRIDNIKAAQEVYTGLQCRALGLHEARQEVAPYLVA